MTKFNIDDKINIRAAQPLVDGAAAGGVFKQLPDCFLDAPHPPDPLLSIPSLDIPLKWIGENECSAEFIFPYLYNYCGGPDRFDFAVKLLPVGSITSSELNDWPT
jgi:hypothetical protein